MKKLNPSDRLNLPDREEGVPGIIGVGHTMLLPLTQTFSETVHHQIVNTAFIITIASYHSFVIKL